MAITPKSGVIEARSDALTGRTSTETWSQGWSAAMLGRTLYVATSLGQILRSTGGTTSWEEVGNGLDGGSVWSLHTMSTAVLATTTRGRLFRLEHAAAFEGKAAHRWTQIDSMAGGLKPSPALVEASGMLLLGTLEGKVVVSDDEGASWRLQAELDAVPIMALTACEGDPQSLYAATQQGQVYASRDSGRTWQRAPSLPAEDEVHGIACRGSQPHVVAVAGKRGVHITSDEGGTWHHTIEEDTRPGVVEDLLFRDDGGSAFLWAWGQNGLYRRRLPVP